ncbi:hypothetical protein EDB83DRAFT_2325380 [Lactarius deliciosus]|nr:hypothetical protein EDB83DRAFT_2325380 [Lactarius deliciosus]
MTAQAWGCAACLRMPMSLLRGDQRRRPWLREAMARKQQREEQERERERDSDWKHEKCRTYQGLKSHHKQVDIGWGTVNAGLAPTEAHSDPKHEGGARTKMGPTTKMGDCGKKVGREGIRHYPKQLVSPRVSLSALSTQGSPQTHLRGADGGMWKRRGCGAMNAEEGVRGVALVRVVTVELCIEMENVASLALRPEMVCNIRVNRRWPIRTVANGCYGCQTVPDRTEGMVRITFTIRNT